MSRSNTFYSLGLMPALIAIGHLAPSIGAIRAVTGSYHFPGRLIGLIGSITTIVVCNFPEHLSFEFGFFATFDALFDCSKYPEAFKKYIKNTGDNWMFTDQTILTSDTCRTVSDKLTGFMVLCFRGYV